MRQDSNKHQKKSTCFLKTNVKIINSAQTNENKTYKPLNQNDSGTQILPIKKKKGNKGIYMNKSNTSDEMKNPLKDTNY